MLIQGSNVFIKQAQQLSCPVKVKPEVVKPEDKESPSKSEGGDSNGRDGKGGKAKSVCTLDESRFQSTLQAENQFGGYARVSF